MVNGLVQFNIGQLLSRYLHSTTIIIFPFGTHLAFSHHYQGSIDFDMYYQCLMHSRAPRITRRRKKQQWGPLDLDLYFSESHQKTEKDGVSRAVFPLIAMISNDDAQKS